MNHNILNKIVETHIQNRIREREDKIYAYQFHILECDPSIKIVAAKDKQTLFRIIIKDILQNELRILADFVDNSHDRTLPPCMLICNNEGKAFPLFKDSHEKLKRVISSDRRIYGLFEEYIYRKIEEKNIMVTKYI